MDDATAEAFGFLLEALYERAIRSSGGSADEVDRLGHEICADHASLLPEVWTVHGASSEQVAAHRLEVQHRLEGFFDGLRVRFDPDEPAG